MKPAVQWKREGEAGVGELELASSVAAVGGRAPTWT